MKQVFCVCAGEAKGGGVQDEAHVPLKTVKMFSPDGDFGIYGAHAPLF